MDISAELSTLGLLGSGLSQHARLVTLTSAQDRGLPESLMVEHLSGREAVNELFSFEIDALSVSTDLDLALFIGEELTVGLLQADGSRRAWHGICTSAAWQGADGGVARYRLRLQPALALLTQRRDSYIFQDRNVQDVVTELLADYPHVRFDFALSAPLEQRQVLTQYRESDFDFLVRLLASEGLSWRFEHDQHADLDDQRDGHAKHGVVFFDGGTALPPMDGGDIIRFHGVRATDTDDAIDEMRARRRVQANAVSISSWDPDQLIAPAATQQSQLDNGAVPAMEIYDGSGERIASAAAVASRHSVLMLQALEMENKMFAGAGAVRRMAAGHTFTLTQHERFEGDDSRFKVLWVRHEARNNYGAQIKGAQAARVEPGTYRNEFGCVRDSVAIVPRSIAAAAPATALGPQTALIVGLANAVSTTTRDHRVKVQFPWQRGASSNPGGLSHDLDATGCAPGDDTSGTWVRVSEALAGPNWGSQFTPRIGTEVLIDFIEGDIDRPLVVAQLYTGDDLPPFSAGVDSGANHAGTLSGIHSHNFDGQGFNQWQLDDTTGQMRTRLASSTAATQLNLGYLIAQEPTSSQRGAYRGSGFELRTDAWSVVRGGEGVLLSTCARSQLGSSVTSTQMDAVEALAQLHSAQELATVLCDAAQAQQALTSADTAKATDRFVSMIDSRQNGKYKNAVGGQAPLKSVGGTRNLDPAHPVEKFGAPIVLMDSAASVNWATPASTIVYAGEQLDWTTQADLHLAAAHTASTAAANAIGLFSHSGGIQAIAANGPVSIGSHTDQLEIIADQAVTVISVNDTIEIAAKEKIVLQAGQSSITLEGKNITFACPGNFTVKGGSHKLDGGAAASPVIGKLPDTRMALYDEAFILKDEKTGQPLVNQPYRIKRIDGSYEEGLTDENGSTHLVSTTEQEILELHLISL